MRLTLLLEAASTVHGREKVDAFLRKNSMKLQHVSQVQLNWIREHVPEKFQIWFLTNLMRRESVDVPAPGVVDALNWFGIHSKKLPITDIGQYTVSQLLTAYQTHQTGTTLDHPDYSVLYDGADGKLIQTHTKEGAIKFSTGTRWCTGATESKNDYHRYATIGNIYLFIKQQKKVQIVFEMRACRDSTDRALSSAEITKLFKIPTLLQLVTSWLLSANHVPTHVWEYWFNVLKKVSDDQAEHVANLRVYHPKTSYDVELVKEVLGYEPLDTVTVDVNGEFVRMVNEDLTLENVCEYMSDHPVSPLVVYHWFESLDDTQKTALMNGKYTNIITSKLHVTPTYLEYALKYAYRNTIKQVVEMYRKDLTKIHSKLLELF